MTTETAVSYSDQAIEVLRKTEDGDLLDGRDLALLQAVVNSGGQALSERGHARWAYIRQSVDDGTYQQRAFCGVPGLTQDSEGYVLWKGVSVEHYSFRTEDRARMIDAARELGAICMTLEESGEKVTSGAVMRMFTKLHEGPEGVAPRFCAVWVIREKNPQLAIEPLRCQSRAALVDEARQIQERYRQTWGEMSHGVRCVAIHSREDLENLRRAFDSDRHWLRQHFWRDAVAAVERFPEQLDREFAGHALPSRSDFVRALIGPALERVTSMSVAALEAEEAAVQQFVERERAH